MTDYIHVFLCASAGLLAFFESCGENSPFVRNYHRITEYESFFFFFFCVACFANCVLPFATGRMTVSQGSQSNSNCEFEKGER